MSEDLIQLNVDGSTRLRATTAADGRDVSWSIVNDSVARLSTLSGKNIVITALSPGRTTVTARVGAYSASCQVTVSGIVLSKSSIEISTNGFETLTLSYFGEAANVATWEWSSSNVGVAVVQKTTSGATVQAVAAGSTVITCSGSGYAAICQVQVVPNEADAVRATLSGGLLSFGDILSDLKKMCRENPGESLSYITDLTVPTRQGILYDGYTSENDTGYGVAGTRKYYENSGAYQISNITFIPKSGATGEVTISYVGYSTGAKTFTGTIVVELEQDDSTLAYASLNGAPVQFRAEDFFAYCMAVNNRSLQYAVFDIPDTRYGTLYYNYVSANVFESVVSANTRYARTYNPSISNITFVPNSTYAGSFTISFTGYDAQGTSFPGVIRISVSNPNGTDFSGSSSGNRLSYETSPGARVSFTLSDFTEESYDRTGYQLDYIYFTSLPASNRGTIYYDRDDEVETDDKYYRRGSGRRIEDLSFVADDDYTGSFNINFTGVNTEGKSFSARIYMTVSEYGAYTVEYSVRSGERLWFTTSGFSRISRDATGRDFERIRFTSLPPSGTLYYGESTDTSFSLVTLSTSYYRATAGQRLLSEINYLAPSGTHTFLIPFTGYNTQGVSFQGRVSISVSPGDGSGTSATDGSPTYFTSGPAVALQSSVIVAHATSQVGEIATVRISQPDRSAGRIVRNFISPGQYSLYDDSQEYAPETVNQLFFLPKAGFSGNVKVQYTARSRQGLVYSSYLTFNVAPPTVSRYFTDMADRAWAVPAVDFFRYYSVLNGVTANTYEPDSPARRGAFITALSRMYSFPPYEGTGGYQDVEPGKFYTSAIAGARALGITGSSQYFYPDYPVTRQDAAVYLYRCLRRAGTAPVGSYADLARFTDASQIAYYAVEAMGSLVQLGVFEGNDGRLNPTQALTRLQMAAILYRAVT